MDYNIADVVREIGKQHQKENDEIDRILKILDENWITTLSEYLSMNVSQRRVLGLPVVLDRELEDYEATKAAAASIQLSLPVINGRFYCLM